MTDDSSGHEKMPLATLRALRASIRKWQKIVDGTGACRCGSNCALCKRFGPECQLPSGEKCPVYTQTDESGCVGSPWADFRRAATCVEGDNMGEAKYAKTQKAKRAARRMLKFLQDLLPKAQHRTTAKNQKTTSIKKV